MEWMYFGIIAFLFILAAFDLWVGVSNDAVNFLNLQMLSIISFANGKKRFLYLLGNVIPPISKRSSSMLM